MPHEIERKYLLKSRPKLPPGARVLRMEQGYFTDDPGRLRRTTAPDGTGTYTHTVKTGQGLVHEETEREITREQFEAEWPRTEGRRLAKTRTCVPDGGLIWEIDDYDAVDLVLAEVELPSADTVVTIPDWLAPHIDREVTDEPVYQNYEIALRAARTSSRASTRRSS